MKKKKKFKFFIQYEPEEQTQFRLRGYVLNGHEAEMHKIIEMQEQNEEGFRPAFFVAGFYLPNDEYVFKFVLNGN